RIPVAEHAERHRPVSDDLIAGERWNVERDGHGAGLEWRPVAVTDERPHEADVLFTVVVETCGADSCGLGDALVVAHAVYVCDPHVAAELDVTHRTSPVVVACCAHASRACR